MSKAFLSKPLRTQLENTVKAAREVAETAAYAALVQLGVGEAKPPEYLTEAQKELRRRLRTHGRSVGDEISRDDKSQSTLHLVREVAYEHWHRMLFARFLAENNLLLWEPGASVSLAECDELVQDPATSLGAKSGWELAGKLAARMLPQVFKPSSPVFELALAREHQRELERLLAALPTEVFQASDSLGWVYQFWQAKRKDEVNASEVKIGADELPAVTQLFTEDYMVEFQLHNSLGAWWVTRFPHKPCPVELTYLRRLEDGTPAAGKFEGWPDHLCEFKLLDPCCGSGHFLVAAFLMLVPMRMAAEGLSAADAVDAVLGQNLFGLELDARCVEIAVFALALAAWRFQDASGEHLGVRTEMPAPNIACCGLPVAARVEQWEALVSATSPDSAWLRQEMRVLHRGLSQAPLLGSLLDPVRILKTDLATPDIDLLRDLFMQGLSSERSSKYQEGQDDTTDETSYIALGARGLFDVARILVDRYNLVITNVPYLVRAKQSEALRAYGDLNYPAAKNDLANVFLERCLELTKHGNAGVVQVVMPQNWLFLTSYKKQREILLKRVKWNLLARLGPGAFETITGEVVNVILLTLTCSAPPLDFSLRGLDARSASTTQGKANLLRVGPLTSVNQKAQRANPDAMVTLTGFSGQTLLGEYAGCFQGTSTGDNARFVRMFWELRATDQFKYFQGPSNVTKAYGGRESVVLWDDVSEFEGAAIRGDSAWGLHGVAIGQMTSLPSTLYTGQLFSNSTPVIIPKRAEDLPAVWCFCSSSDFYSELRKINPKLSVDNGYVSKIEVDFPYWREVAATRYPGGLPEPYSDDVTQWVFHGHPQVATHPLQVAVSRLLGYMWPAEMDENMRLSKEARSWVDKCKRLSHHIDDDGIVCLGAVRGEKSAHERLLALLIDSWETTDPTSWKSSDLDRLLSTVDAAGKSLDLWLRDQFFEQHAKLFDHRPIIWHIWDGLKDGFGALVNYHKLDAKNLERLIHTYLGDWIRIQEAGVTSKLDGAEQRLAAALQLKARLTSILVGEVPYDIFVRWKALDRQPIGWNPDLRDGVRLNIRPFVTAEVLRHNKSPKLNVKWDKDRGKDTRFEPWFSVFDGVRINDYHVSLADKVAARNQGK